MTRPLPDPVSYKANPLRKLRYVWELTGCVEERSGASRSQIVRDMVRLYFRRGLGPLAYIEQALWRPQLNDGDKLRALTCREYELRIAQLNPPGFHCVSGHKAIEAALLRQAGIPVPEYLGYLHEREGVGVAGERLTTLEQLTSYLQGLAPLKVCFKLSLGQQGKGFAAAEVQVVDGVPMARDLSPGALAVPLADFARERLADGLGEGYLLQRYLEQHPVLARFNPASVNTLRIWVVQGEAEVRIRGAVLRIGRAGSLTDNTSGGGLRSVVDLDSGRLGPAGYASLFSEEFTHHPDSGVLIEGVQLPYWQECVELARETLRVLPRLTFTGMDIAIGEQGPVVIETNEHPHRISARNFDAPLSDLLDPERELPDAQNFR